MGQKTLISPSNHGGGWTLGDLEGEDIACRSTCVKASVVVVSVDYRLYEFEQASPLSHSLTF